MKRCFQTCSCGSDSPYHLFNECTETKVIRRKIKKFLNIRINGNLRKNVFKKLFTRDYQWFKFSVANLEFIFQSDNPKNSNSQLTVNLNSNF